MTFHRTRQLAVIAWFALVTTVSLAPLSIKIVLHTAGPLHPWVHLAVFFATTALIMFDTDSHGACFLRAIFMICFCAALEAGQDVIYHNHFESRDLQIDCLAILLAWASFAMLGPLAVPAPSSFDPEP